jgi:hypothetical protein
MPKTLYDRLGAASGIAKLVDDVVDAHLNNPLVKTRFERGTAQAANRAVEASKTDLNITKILPKGSCGDLLTDPFR